MLCVCVWGGRGGAPWAAFLLCFQTASDQRQNDVRKTPATLLNNAGDARLVNPGASSGTLMTLTGLTSPWGLVLSAVCLLLVQFRAECCVHLEDPADCGCLHTSVVSVFVSMCMCARVCSRARVCVCAYVCVCPS